VAVPELAPAVAELRLAGADFQSPSSFSIVPEEEEYEGDDDSDMN
jgi:hypothetical protein